MSVRLFKDPSKVVSCFESSFASTRRRSIVFTLGFSSVFGTNVYYRRLHRQNDLIRRYPSPPILLLLLLRKRLSVCVGLKSTVCKQPISTKKSQLNPTPQN
jgi:hypothetical protein